MNINDIPIGVQFRVSLPGGVPSQSKYTRIKDKLVHGAVYNAKTERGTPVEIYEDENCVICESEGKS